LRGRGIAVTTGALVAGLVLGVLLSPPPADAVAKEIIQLQQQVAILLQNQQTMQTAMTQNFATLKTLLEQSVDSQNRLTSSMGGMQKTIQDLQANTGSKLDSMGGQVQALSDTLDDMKARIGKLSGQVATAQSTLQSLDAKVSAMAPAPQPAQGSGDVPGGAAGTQPAGGGAPPAAAPPPADLLYTNGLRDFTGANYDLANQEFHQYLRYYPQTDLASNAHFYLGEISYAQGRYPDSIAEYDQVLNNYPNSFKRADARLKKAYALLKLHETKAAVTELRRVIHENPGTEQSRKAQARLRQLGVRTR
jgi:tol-pal system protein YbgF